MLQIKQFLVDAFLRYDKEFIENFNRGAAARIRVEGALTVCLWQKDTSPNVFARLLVDIHENLTTNFFVVQTKDNKKIFSNFYSAYLYWQKTIDEISFVIK